MDSLSIEVQVDLLRKKGGEWVDDSGRANPKALYDWLKDEYSTPSTYRRVQLFDIMNNTRTAKGQDPTEDLANIQEAIDELKASIKEGTTAEEFLEDYKAFAMLAALPSEYGHVVSRFYLSETISRRDVRRAVIQERGTSTNRRGECSYGKVT